MSLNELAFYFNDVKKHDLTYTTLSHIQTKGKSFLLSLLEHQILYMDPNVDIEMKRLKKTTWIPFIFQLKNVHHSHVIIQTLNTFSLRQHYENYEHNLQMFDILCLIETKKYTTH